MDINYSFAKKELLLTKKNDDDLHSFLLTNQFGDIIHQSFKPEVCKSFGFFQRDHDKNKLIKVIDFIGPEKVLFAIIFLPKNKFYCLGLSARSVCRTS